jgi:hypothetical protein
MARDRVLHTFLHTQFEQASALVRQSDIVDLVAIDSEDNAPTRYRVRFQCRGAIRNNAGGIEVRADRFEVGFVFFPDYLRRVDPYRLVTWLGPAGIVHPQVLPPFMCLGHVLPGLPLVDLIYQVYEVITFFKRAPHDPLNPDPAIAAWTRAHQDLFPLDRRPLKRLPARQGDQR